MRKFDEEKHKKRMEEIHREKERWEKERELYDSKREVHELKRSMLPIKMPTTTKLIVAFLFANFTVVEVFSMIAMWHFENLDALYVLITTILAEPISFAVYAAKAYAGKKQEEQVKLERDKMSMEEADEPVVAAVDNSEEEEPELNPEEAMG